MALFFAPLDTAATLWGLVWWPAHPGPLAWTMRAAEVLAGPGEGRSNAQIASRLFLSEATVKGYVSRPLDKPGRANRTQAGLIAHDAGT